MCSFRLNFSFQNIYKNNFSELIFEKTLAENLQLGFSGRCRWIEFESFRQLNVRAYSQKSGHGDFHRLFSKPVQNNDSS